MTMKSDTMMNSKQPKKPAPLNQSIQHHHVEHVIAEAANPTGAEAPLSGTSVTNNESITMMKTSEPKKTTTICFRQ